VAARSCRTRRSRLIQPSEIWMSALLETESGKNQARTDSPGV
jgi:hypothetical protein